MFSGISATLVLMTTLATAPENMVLEFSTTGCVPCQSMSPIVQKLQQEGYALQQCSAQQQPELVQKFRIRMYPTFILIKNGQEVERIEGMVSEARLRELTPKMEEHDVSSVPRQSPTTRTILTQGVAGMTIANGATGYERGVLGKPAIPEELKSQVENKTAANNASRGDYSKRDDPSSETLSNADLDRYLPDIKLLEKTAIVRGQSDNATQSSNVMPVSADPLLSSTVRIRTREKNGVNFGTGTIVESKVGNAVILTCAHILRDLTPDGKIEVEFFTAKGPVMMIGKRLSDNLEADVGLITVPSDIVFPIVKVAALNNSCRLNDPVVSYGCSSGQDPSREELTVSACNKYVGPENIECTGVPTRGRSGGGLFNIKGEVVGICSAADPQANRGLYCGLLPIIDMLKEQNLVHLIQYTNSNRSVANANLESIFPPDVDALNGKLIAKLDETKNSPLARSIEQIVSTDPQGVIQPVAAAITNLSDLQQAQGTKLTIIIEVPGSPEKTRTVIIPAATEKLIHELTRDKQHKANFHGLLGVGYRRSLQPTDFNLKLNSIPIVSREINPNWQGHAPFSRNLANTSSSQVESKNINLYSLKGFKKFERTTSDVVRNSDVAHNSAEVINFSSAMVKISDTASLGSFGLKMKHVKETQGYSIRHPSVLNFTSEFKH